MHCKDKSESKSKSKSKSILGVVKSKVVKPKKSKVDKEAAEEAAKKAAEEVKQKEFAAFTQKQKELTKDAIETKKKARELEAEDRKFKEEQANLQKEASELEKEAAINKEISKEFDKAIKEVKKIRPIPSHVKPKIEFEVNTIDVEVQPIDVEIKPVVNSLDVDEKEQQPNIETAEPKQKVPEADRGKTSLHLAVESENISEVSRILWETKNATINQKDNENGDTALHIAARNNNLPIVTSLLNAGADHELENDQQKKPKDEATKKIVIDELKRPDYVGTFVIKHINDALTSPVILKSYLGKKYDKPGIVKPDIKDVIIDIKYKESDTIEQIINNWIKENPDKKMEIKFLNSFMANFPEKYLLEKHPNEEKKGSEKKSINDSTIAAGGKNRSAGDYVIDEINQAFKEVQDDIVKFQSEIAEEIFKKITEATSENIKKDLLNFWPPKIKSLNDDINDPKNKDLSIEKIIINWEKEHLTPKFGNPYEKAFHESVLIQQNKEQFFNALKSKVQDQLKKKPSENKDAVQESIQSFISDCKKNDQKPLCEAVNRGDLNLVNELIDLGYSPTEKADTGQTPLHLAIIKAAEEVEKVLVFAIEGNDLAFLTKSKEMDIFRKLLETAKNVNIKDNEGRTPLHYAVNVNAPQLAEQIVTLLIQAGADLNSKNNKKQTPLSLAEENKNHEVAKIFQKQNTSGQSVINTINFYINHPKRLAFAVAEFSPEDKKAKDFFAEKMKDLINDINNSKSENLTIGEIIKKWKNENKIDLENSKNMQIVNNFLEIPLIKEQSDKRPGESKDAVRQDTVKTSERPSSVGPRGSGAKATTSSRATMKTSLHLAVENADLGSFNKELNQANVNIQDDKGNTALHYAAQNSNQGIILLMIDALIKAGALNLKNNDGETPLILARKNPFLQNSKVISLLESHYPAESHDTALEWHDTAGEFVTKQITEKANGTPYADNMKSLCEAIRNHNPNNKAIDKTKTIEKIIGEWEKAQKKTSLHNIPESNFLKQLMETPEIKEQLQKTPYEPKKGISIKELRQQELRRMAKTGGF